MLTAWVEPVAFKTVPAALPTMLAAYVAPTPVALRTVVTAASDVTFTVCRLDVAVKVTSSAPKPVVIVFVPAEALIVSAPAPRSIAFVPVVPTVRD